MRTSREGKKLIEYFEGRKRAVYPDPATGGAPWTVGIGHTGPDVKKGDVWTDAQIDAAFTKDLQRFEQGVEKYVTVNLDQNQFDALVAFSFNVGLGNLQSSTLLKMLNAGDYSGAAGQFQRWDKAAGKSMLGLRRRRAAEAAMFRGITAEAAIAAGLDVA